MTGSITHCAGYRAAAVARVADMSLLGIDAEPHGPLPEGVAGAIALADERTMLRRLLHTHPGTYWGRVLFSAKESIYKAWFPVTQRPLAFEQARVSLAPDDHTFTASILVDGSRIDGGPPLTVLRGRFGIERGLVLTATSSA